ncbi:hypothetical protein CGRA01v4_03596 [Colletotrichum graminicola]|nr:hypothetical protein CGRA01v4_03596 [Colletotrichum graminicola]
MPQQHPCTAGMRGSRLGRPAFLVVRMRGGIIHEAALYTSFGLHDAPAPAREPTTCECRGSSVMA